MSETPAETPGRAAATYVDEDGGEISLPGYLAAEPSIVASGDTFTYDAAYSVEVLAGERFVEAALEDVKSPHARQTKAELAEILGVDPSGYSKDEFVSLADDRARMFPPVPGATADPVEEVVPIPGQDVHPDPLTAPPGVDVDPANPTPEV